jgi:hypothetical protein
VVVPLKRQATPQRARKGASRLGFDALARTTLLRTLRMRYGHSARRASRIRANASETRLMGIFETGSGYRCNFRCVISNTLFQNVCNQTVLPSIKQLSANRKEQSVCITNDVEEEIDIDVSADGRIE